MTSLADRAEKEVVDLNRFFERWFRGERLAASNGIARLEAALSPGFQIIFPSGREMDRGALIDEVRGRHGSRAELGESFRIEVRNLAVRHERDGLVLATYEEWQHAGPTASARRSSVLFERHDTAPNGVRWLHLHECWLPGHTPDARAGA